MGQVTGISWCDHTFNPWRGCTKVSDGCKFCYAEKLAKRNPGVLGKWGPAGTRPVAAESYWKEPLKWDAAARADGVKRTVFCLSLGDFWEEREDLIETRTRTLRLFAKCPNLVPLILTKRPENAAAAFDGNRAMYFSKDVGQHEVGSLLEKFWFGVSVEDQATAAWRVPLLNQVPSAGKFLSIEPLLGAVDLGWRRDWKLPGLKRSGFLNPIADPLAPFATIDDPLINWVICGGESGSKSRPMNPSWVLKLAAQLDRSGVPFFFKQWGRFQPLMFAPGTPPHLWHHFPDYNIVVPNPGGEHDPPILDIGLCQQFPEHW